MSRESKILEFAIRYKQSHNGNSPSYEQIMDAVGITSKSLIKYFLDKLEADGLLEHDGVRSIVIPNSEWKKVAEEK